MGAKSFCFPPADGELSYAYLLCELGLSEGNPLAQVSKSCIGPSHCLHPMISLCVPMGWSDLASYPVGYGGRRGLVGLAGKDRRR